MIMQESSENTAFDCNICIEQAKDPVVTVCGHLYCWPCLYRWLRVQNGCQSCPVCKAGIDQDKVIPLYGRGSEEKDPRKRPVLVPNVSEDIVPRRPLGQRPPAPQRLMHPDGSYNVQLGLGMLPAIFGHNHNGSGRSRDPLTPEQHNQAFISRLLLMLGSFVIMCLLLF